MAITLHSGFTPLLGLDLGITSIKLVELRPTGKRWRLHRVGQRALELGWIVDGQVKNLEAVAQAIRELWEELDTFTTHAAITIGGPTVIVKKIQTPKMTELELEDQIIVEAESYIPFDMDEVHMDFQILGATDDADTMDVLLIACKNSTIENVTETLIEAGLEAKVVDFAPFCQENTFHATLQPKESKKKKEKKGSKRTEKDAVALINLGGGQLNLNILVDGVSEFTRDQPFNGQQVLESIQHRYGVSRDESETILTEVLAGHGTNEAPRDCLEEVIKPQLGSIVTQIETVLDGYHPLIEENRPRRVLLMGGTALLPGLAQALEEKLSLSVERADPFKNMATDKVKTNCDFKLFAPRFATATGLALRGKIFDNPKAKGAISSKK
ncbi:type IV pilus biogenesis protein PilM [Magnetococcales bacterium HHB-1]